MFFQQPPLNIPPHLRLMLHYYREYPSRLRTITDLGGIVSPV